MKNFTFGFIAGAFLIGIVSIILIKKEQDRWFVLGHKNGEVAGLAKAARAIRAEFGAFEGQGETTLFIAKPHPVVSVTIDGVKTIRVID